jgi:hypothetical protein
MRPTPTIIRAPPILAGQLPLATQDSRPAGRRASRSSPPSSARIDANTAVITNKKTSATMYFPLAT